MFVIERFTDNGPLFIKDMTNLGADINALFEAITPVLDDAMYYENLYMAREAAQSATDIFHEPFHVRRLDKA
jgi:hypothetical protein